MILKETTDIDEIKSILCNSVIYDCISDDDSPLCSDFEPPINEKYLYVGGYCKGEIIALMVYHKEDGKNFCHVQVLPEHRENHALEFGERSLMFRGNDDLYAVIPNIYKNVLKFADLFGFVIIDTVKNSGIKNGKTFDDYVLKYKRD